MSSQSNAGGGVGLTGLLTVLFVGLKLGNVIDWSWWWVLSPLWIPSAVAAAVLIVVAVGIPVVGALRETIRPTRR